MRGLLKSVAAVILATGAVVIASAACGEVKAQTSTDAIINALKPAEDPGLGATRGIKLGVSPAPQPTLAAPASAAPTAPRPLAARPPSDAGASGPSVNLTVNFPSGSADLTPEAKASLDALGRALASRDLASFRFRIEGHTDNVGSREQNLMLSQQRAEAVVAYLTGQYRVAPVRLRAIGMGQERPLIQTPPQTPEPRNRRVQVINLGA